MGGGGRAENRLAGICCVPLHSKLRKKERKRTSSLGFHLALEALCNMLLKNAMHCGKRALEKVGSNACFEIFPFFFLFFFS